MCRRQHFPCRTHPVKFTRSARYQVKRYTAQPSSIEPRRIMMVIRPHAVQQKAFSSIIILHQCLFLPLHHSRKTLNRRILGVYVRATGEQLSVARCMMRRNMHTEISSPKIMKSCSINAIPNRCYTTCCKTLVLQVGCVTQIAWLPTSAICHECCARATSRSCNAIK